MPTVVIQKIRFIILRNYKTLQNIYINIYVNDNKYYGFTNGSSKWR